ncbi:MAG TPA: S8 family serine peptidase [Anaerolineaceae bacterium]|nr:S8 family serine peptidase [Anaerolineaceae bacterium]
MKNLFRAFACLALALNLGSTSTPAALPSVHVAPQVLADTAREQNGDFLVVLRSQADLPALTARTRSAMEKAAPGDQAHFRGLVAQEVYSGLRAAADRWQPAVLSELKRLGAEAQPFWIANLIAVKGKRAVVEAMAARPDVLEIESNLAFRVPLPEPDAGARAEISPAATQGINWNVKQIHAPDVWALGYTGQGIRVGVADTGMQWDHPALKEHYLGWNGTSADHTYTWHDAIHDQNTVGSTSNPCGYALKAPCDDYGHGTHVTGIAVGSDGGANQIGVAPGAKWMGCRNMDQGVGRPSTYIECLEFFLAPNEDATKHADVVSNSYTCPSDPQDPQYEYCTTSSLTLAVANMRAAGIFMAVAAGNEGPGCSTIADPPSLEPSAITIGATDPDNQIATFSSRGPVKSDGSGRRKPDLVTPGTGKGSDAGIWSSIPGNSYGNKSGTSMATPHVAGAVALLWSAVPSLRGDVDATQALFEDTAQHLTTTEGCGGDTGSTVPNNVYGYGLINVRAAVFKILFPFSSFFPLIAR